MAKTQQEIFLDKVALIVEFNKRSPLFVRAAAAEIEKNNIDEAVALLLEGLKVFPSHPVALILLGRAYALLGREQEALELFTTVADAINAPETYRYYKNELETIGRQRSAFRLNARSTFINEGVMPEPLPAEQEEEAAQASFEDFGVLAEKISRAKMPPPPASQDAPQAIPQNYKNEAIISETMAKILVSQGKLLEAIQVYEKLRKQEPARQNEYTRAILELKSRLEAGRRP